MVLWSSRLRDDDLQTELESIAEQHNRKLKATIFDTKLNTKRRKITSGRWL